LPSQIRRSCVRAALAGASSVFPLAKYNQLETRTS
jgi:hypothetical protein